AEAATSVPRVSGSLAAHYAPLTLLRQVKSDELAGAVRRLVQAGRRVAVLAHGVCAPCDAGATLHWQAAASEPAAYARALYANLRMLDALGAEIILVEEVPPGPDWQAVADRLGRAAAGSGVS
ncbi:MAG: translation factor Sua5, partial [Proteobacteria bacterium]|nr:translation factor Sua5 [Pseudomonadota bacterium]